MENLINSTANLDALTADVKAKMTEAFAAFTAFEAITSPLKKQAYDAYRATFNDYANRDVEAIIAAEKIEAENELASSLGSAVLRIFDVLRNELENIEHGEARRTKQLSKLDQRVEEELERQRYHANKEAAETIERIPSDFFLIDAKQQKGGKGRNRYAEVKIVFQLNGGIFEKHSTFNETTGELRDKNPGYYFDKKAGHWTHHFNGNMTVEEVAKAAHALDCIKLELQKATGITPSVEAPAEAA